MLSDHPHLSLLMFTKRFDTGPSLLLLPHIFRSIFEDLGTSLEAEKVELLKCHPNYNIWFHDGENFQLSTDMAQMKQEVERFEGKAGFSRFLNFVREAHEHYELSVSHVLRKNFTSLASMLRPSFLQHLLALHPFESIWSRASKYFRTERLRRVFTFGSMYMGMSPFDAPGTYSLLQYTELAEGIWYPRGGFHRIMDAVVEVGKRYGVTYHLNDPVSSILLTPNKRAIKGVVLESGEEVMADVVIINADLVYAYNNLLPPAQEAKALKRRPASCSSISFYWATDRIIPELVTHNIFLAEKYRESFDDIFKRQQIPDEPSFYVNVPSRVDTTAAPAGKDSIVVLVPVGHLLDEAEGRGINTERKQDWDRMVARARDVVISTIKVRTGADLKERIVHESVHTPATWKESFNLDKGAILGLSHDFFNVLSFRPKTKHPHIDRLHFVGASTHPGTGVPICVAGARLVADQILDSMSMKKPWEAERSNGAVAPIDQAQVRPLLSTFHFVILALVALVFGLLYRP